MSKQPRAQMSEMSSVCLFPLAPETPLRLKTVTSSQNPSAVPELVRADRSFRGKRAKNHLLFPRFVRGWDMAVGPTEVPELFGCPFLWVMSLWELKRS